MNLKTCETCGKKYSDTLKQCPHCGYKREENKVKYKSDKLFNENKKRKRTVLAAIAIIVIIVSVFIANILIKSNKIKHLEQEADSLYKQGNYETAITVYNEILTIKDIPEINTKIKECETAINTIYFGKLTLVNDAFKTSEKHCRKIVDFTCIVWLNTLFNEDEYNEGSFDPNVSLSNLYNTQEMEDSISALISIKHKIDLQMKNLQFVPEKYAVLFSEIQILYEKYNDMYYFVAYFPTTYKLYTFNDKGYGDVKYSDKAEDYFDEFEEQSEKVDSLIEIGPIDKVSEYIDLTKTDIYSETVNLADISKELHALFDSYSD